MTAAGQAAGPGKASEGHFRGGRSTKRLAVTQEFTAYQRRWFTELRERVAAGEPFALVSASAAQEIFRAMDIPYVVNHWYTGLIAAKQKSPRYLEQLAAAGYPDDDGTYSSLPLAAALGNDDDPPWGGLPRPDFVHSALDVEGDIGFTWALEQGALYLPVQTTVSNHVENPRWWERIRNDWDVQLAPERLGLLVDEYKAMIRVLEDRTGRRFSEPRLREVMHLVNEQEECFARTRDLLARSVPAPASVVDTMPATMIPQWHRGTEWGRDAARALFDEISERVANGVVVEPDERIRLMFLGTGVWSNMRFYEYLHEEYKAVPVWSIYLAIAADGYIRYFDRDRDPLAALASRFLGMELNSWDWHVHEAQVHDIDGVISAGPVNYFVRRGLEDAGFPVLALGVSSTVDNREWRDEEIRERMKVFMRERVEPRAKLRHARRDAGTAPADVPPPQQPHGKATR